MKKTKAVFLICALCALAAFFAGCSQGGGDKVITDPVPETPAVSATSADTEPPAVSDTVSSSGEELTETPPVTSADASVGDADEKWETADESYFSDAIFIGNSRTVGFFMYSGLSNAKMVASTGLNVRSFFTTESESDGAGGYITAEEAVRRTSGWTKAYIMLGTNEIGWYSNEVFIEKYRDIIVFLRSLQPDTVIYIQSVLPVDRSYDNPKDEMYNNEKINIYNALLRELSDSESCVYLDVASAVSAEDGTLAEGAAPDGVHLNREYCKKWLEYLKCHIYSAD